MTIHLVRVVTDGWSLQDWASLASIVSVGAIVIAWATYVRTNQKDRKAHVNTMFREYLRLDFEYHMRPPAEREEDALRRLRAYKMWVLDEINEWVDGEERKRLFWSNAAIDSRDRLVRNWRETIRYHLHRHSCAKYWDAFLVSRHCYSESFFAFAQEWHIDSPKHADDHQGCEFCTLMKEDQLKASGK